MNKLINKIIKTLKNPLWIIVFLNNRGIHLFSDEKYLKILYRLQFQNKLDFKKVKTFNEKLQWLKLYDRNPLYTKLVDKYEVKKYIASIIGEKYIIPTIGIYDNFDDIDFKKLPNQFVIKCTHDSGGVIICKDKSKFNQKHVKKKIEKLLKKNFYYVGREWPYKNVQPRIIIEEYMEDKKTKELRDYKFFCFNGIPKFMFLATDRQINQTKFNFYDMNFKLLPFTQGHPNDFRKISKPKKFDEMVELSKQLSKNIPHVRVDFYEINGNVYFGEMTFYHYSGFTKFNPKDWDEKLGKYIDLSLVNKNEK